MRKWIGVLFAHLVVVRIGKPPGGLPKPSQVAAWMVPQVVSSVQRKMKTDCIYILGCFLIET